MSGAAPSAGHVECNNVAERGATGGTSTVAAGTLVTSRDAGKCSTSTTAHLHLEDLVRQGFLLPKSKLLWVPTTKG